MILGSLNGWYKVLSIFSLISLGLMTHIRGQAEAIDFKYEIIDSLCAGMHCGLTQLDSGMAENPNVFYRLGKSYNFFDSIVSGVRITKSGSSLFHHDAKEAEFVVYNLPGLIKKSKKDNQSIISVCNDTANGRFFIKFQNMGTSRDSLDSLTFWHIYDFDNQTIHYYFEKIKLSSWKSSYLLLFEPLIDAFPYLTLAYDIKNNIDPEQYITLLSDSMGNFSISLETKQIFNPVPELELAGFLESPIKNGSFFSFKRTFNSDLDVLQIVTPLSIFPNPNSGQFQIRGLNNGQIFSISDLNGRAIHFEQSHHHVSIPNAKSGVYMVRAIDERTNELLTIKVIVK